MKIRLFCGCLAILLISSGVWALDEAVLTPTPERPAHGLSAVKAEKAKADADKEFNAAMSGGGGCITAGTPAGAQAGAYGCKCKTSYDPFWNDGFWGF